jgi:tetratricopeptide (TPR) repeat protein
VRAAEKAPVEKSGGKIGTHVVVIIGSGVLLVAALYMITTMSKTMESTSPATAPPQEAVLSAPASPPLPTAITSRADSLETEIAALEGAARTEKRRELVDLYLQAGRYDLAGNTQKIIAEEQDTEEAWILVGNLYYDWMEGLNGQDRSYYAQQAIAGYQRALVLNPDNLDVRTDMAIAYLYDPQNPMQAIQQTNLVLEQDPDHIQANFNRGIMLMQINRLDEAIEQFQRVKTLIGDTNDVVYQRADAAIDAVRKMQGG